MAAYKAVRVNAIRAANLQQEEITMPNLVVDLQSNVKRVRAQVLEQFSQLSHMQGDIMDTAMEVMADSKSLWSIGDVCDAHLGTLFFKTGAKPMENSQRRKGSCASCTKAWGALQEQDASEEPEVAWASEADQPCRTIRSRQAWHERQFV